MRILPTILLAATLAAATCAGAAPAPGNAELQALYQADQADREAGKIDWKIVGPRDETRRQRVKELAASGELRVSADFLHAAMVYQHGNGPDYFRQAMLWAQRAFELDASNTQARWLACAAEDRWLQNTGLPQVWGTQFMLPRRPDGQSATWTQEPFKRDARTDAERVVMGVPTLAQSAARLDQMNAELNKK
jgi:hypothetical protein